MRGAASLFLWPGRSLYVGPALDADAHAHHALQVSLALDGTLAIGTGPRGAWRAVAGIVIAPDAVHRVRATAALAQLYLDPESDTGRTLARGGTRTLGPTALADARVALARCLRRAATLADAGRAADAVVTAATGVAPAADAPAALDDRVRRVLARLGAAPGRHVPLAELAADVALSRDRLAHLFRAEVGIPIRRYVLWLRIIAAVAGMGARRSLTEVAHATGFADSAHLSRVFRRTFAMPPSAFTGGLARLVVAPEIPTLD